MYRKLFLLLNCILVSQAYGLDTALQVSRAETVRSDGVNLRSSFAWSAGDNYAGLETRSFFIVPVDGFAGHTVLSASLRIYVPSEADSNEDHTFSDGFISPDTSETLTLFDYQSDKRLLTDYSDQATVFADIGSGEVFGTALLTPAVNGQFLTISLNAAGLSALQTAIDNVDPDSSDWLVDTFVLGAAITTLDHAGAAEFFRGDAYQAPSSIPEFTITLAGPSVPAGAGSIRIDFGGTFGAYCSGGDCIGTNLENLLSTDFSGTILIPQSGNEPVFVNDEQSTYLIDAPRASLSFDVAGDEFDLVEIGPVRIQVQNCRYPTSVYEQYEQCNSGGGEGISIEVSDEAAGFIYGLQLTAPVYQPSWLTSSAIPPIESFWNPLLYRAFYLCRDDYSGCIDTADSGWEHSTLDYLHVSWVPAASLDVQPWDSTNTVEPASDKLIAVAVHTTSLAEGDATDFDATQIDPSTLQFGSGDAIPSLLPWATDIDGDADVDMVFGFDTQDTGIVCGDTEVHLAGYALSGQEFTASDVISTAGCATGSCH